MISTEMTGRPESGRLAGRVALVTGASRGIGAAVAKRYAAEGAHVILVARTQGGLEEVDDAIRAAGGNASLCPMDLRKLDDIDRLAVSVAQRFGKLDILVANAGILGVLSPVPHLEPRMWDETFTTNVVAPWRLVRAFDLLLRASDAGRAIFVTDSIAAARQPFWGLYAASKAALEAMVASWAAETRQTNLRVNLVDPGVVGTALRTKAFPGEDPASRIQPDAVTGPFVALAEPACKIHGEIVKP